MRLLPALTALAALATLASAPAARADTAPLDLAFGDFFARPIGPRGLEPTPQLLAAQGRMVRLVGYMVQREQPLPGGFLFAPRPVSMAEHADGEADDLPATTVTVLLPEARRSGLVAYRPGALALTGRLHYGRAVDEAGRVSWLRLELEPEGLAPVPSSSSSH